MSRSSVPFLSSLFRSSEAIDESDAGEGLGVEGAFSPAPDDGIGPQSYPDDCRGPDSGFDLVFVHGLRGSRFKTWMRDGVFWPHDLLKDDLKNVRVITWGYDANIANALTYASLETISGHADTLLSDLVRIRREITRPIIFICHSLGGLIVKQALITSASYYKRYLTLNQIYTSTAGVVFMGTPHRGSSTVSYGEIVAKFAKLLLRQPNDELLQTLRPDSHILDKQRHDFTTISNDMTIVCIREELPTGMGLIVPQVSASYDAFNVMCGAIHANHMSMVKFANNGDEGYKRTIHYIQCIVDERLRKAEPGMLKLLS
ncbi:Alpha/Beta hydrolase protein [Nemania sp. FL0031]|nr:Alpha/Beta hydrolase protein [Nemania sp. FL0031]